MDSGEGTKNSVFYNGCNAPTVLRNLQKRHKPLQTRYQLWSMVVYMTRTWFCFYFNTIGIQVHLHSDRLK